MPHPFSGMQCEISSETIWLKIRLFSFTKVQCSARCCAPSWPLHCRKLDLVGRLGARRPVKYQGWESGREIEGQWQIVLYLFCFINNIEISGQFFVFIWRQQFFVFIWRQTKKPSLLLSFYFHVVLQHLKTFKQTNSRFKRVLCFAILDGWILGFCVTRHLANGQESSYVG